MQNMKKVMLCVAISCVVMHNSYAAIFPNQLPDGTVISGSEVMNEISQATESVSQLAGKIASKIACDVRSKDIEGWSQRLKNKLADNPKVSGPDRTLLVGDGFDSSAVGGAMDAFPARMKQFGAYLKGLAVEAKEKIADAQKNFQKNWDDSRKKESLVSKKAVIVGAVVVATGVILYKLFKSRKGKNQITELKKTV